MHSTPASPHGSTALARRAISSDRPKSLIVTRMGIGVFDPKWWAPRLGLFDAVTAASMARFRGREFRWTILLDADIPGPILDQIVDILQQRDLFHQVQFDFVPSNAYIRSSVRNALRGYFGPSQRGQLQILDDDDATTPELHDLHMSHCQEHYSGVQVCSTPNGPTLDLVRLTTGELTRGTLPVNTTFYGTADQIVDVTQANHGQWLRRADQRGRGLPVLANHPTWLYLNHPHGDGDHAKRSEKLRSAADYGPLTRGLLARFGIEPDELVQAVATSRASPPLVGLTNRRTQPQQLMLTDLKRRADKIKEKAIEINSHLFEDSRPFFYLLRPLPHTNVPAGSTTFTGVGLPGSVIEMWVAGSRSKPKLLRSTTCDEQTGTWTLTVTLAAATWGVSFRQLVDGTQVNQIAYPLTATPRAHNSAKQHLPPGRDRT